MIFCSAQVTDLPSSKQGIVIYIYTLRHFRMRTLSQAAIVSNEGLVRESAILEIYYDIV